MRLDHDDQQGQSLWGIQNIKQNIEYYIGMSASYAPPNNAWETVEGIGKNPAPGLQFITIDENVMKKLIPDEPKIRQNIFVPTKRKRKGGGYHHDDDDNLTYENYEFGDGDGDVDAEEMNEAIVGLD